MLEDIADVAGGDGVGDLVKMHKHGEAQLEHLEMRAPIDRDGNVQPVEAPWNLKGYANNAGSMLGVVVGLLHLVDARAERNGPAEVLALFGAQGERAHLMVRPSPS